jgi:hypothetical protein
MRCIRHLTFFRAEDGQWLGEWQGEVPAPPINVLSLVGDQRTLALNAWLHETQQMITPSGSPYPMIDEAWDLDAWNDCPEHGAVCVDTSSYNWPVFHQRFHLWNAIDQGIEYPDSRHYLQIDTRRREIVANTTSSRPIRASVGNPDTTILDITGSSLQEFHGSLLGPLDRHGERRWVLRDAPKHLSDGIQHELDANSTTVDRALGHHADC